MERKSLGFSRKIIFKDPKNMDNNSEKQPQQRQLRRLEDNNLMVSCGSTNISSSSLSLFILRRFRLLTKHGFLVFGMFLCIEKSKPLVRLGIPKWWVNSLVRLSHGGKEGGMSDD
uniref:Uncharacterized protein n=1 Tax=Opuntia streptacantha TaxID=393608 RepID=A0A7C9AW23_OPUST